MDAANQVFYSYGLAFGSMISFGSYNPTDKNCVKDVLYLSLCNAATAVYACAVIFSILGFKAQHLFDACMERYFAFYYTGWLFIKRPFIFDGLIRNIHFFLLLF